MSRAAEEANRRLLQARDAVDRAYAEPLDVVALARIAYASPAHFIRTFRAAFGETPHRCLQRLAHRADPGDDRQILLERPAPPVYDPDTTDPVRELVSKGAVGGHLFFHADDARATHAELKAKGVGLPEEPTEQPYGLDFGFRDPFGNHLRIDQRFTNPL